MPMTPWGYPDLGVEPRHGWEVATVLVTVKAYPAIGKKTGEAVCVAGVRLDRERPEWIRLFPVPFRQLDAAVQFKKYDIVQLRVRKQLSKSDRRPESYEPDLSTLVLGPNVGSDDATWRRRIDAFGDLLGATTACALYAGAKAHGQDSPSLGLIKPTVKDLLVEPNEKYRPADSAAVDVDLFGTEQEVIEAAPYILKYRYACQEPGCRGAHEQTLIDWEAGQLGRKLVRLGRPDAAAALRRRFLDEICAPTNDVYFYLGNQHQHPPGFLVLGVVYPKAGVVRSGRLF